MSKFNYPPGGVFDGLINLGLVENNGVRQKNPRRVAAALQQHGRARRARREAKEALAPPIAQRRRGRRPGPLPIGTRRFDRVLRIMPPGNWYAGGDLARGAGYESDAAGDLMRSLLANALVTRAPNPDAASGTPTRPEPQWLYCLTAKGESLRELCKLLA